MISEPFRDAVFATGEAEMAAGFGALFSILPIGDFTFLWSPNVPDLATEFSGKTTNIFSHFFQILFSLDTSSNIDAGDYIKKADYRTTDLKAAINSGNEIMIFAKEYYAIREK